MKKRSVALILSILMMLAMNVALARDNYIFCERCQSFYLEGDEYNFHVCAGEQGVQCEICKGWFKPGYEYNTHSCFQKNYVYCWVCGGTFLEGNEYRNHICVRNPDPSQKPIGTLYVDTANGGNLRMRARPDTNANEVASLKYGTAVSLYSYVNSQWAYVGYRGNYGYCMIRYLSDVAPGLKPTPTPVPSVSQNMYDNFRAADYRVLVNPTVPTGFVNLRWAPSLDAPVQGIYYANSVLRVISTNGTWCQVIDDQKNVCGFMMSAYMKRRAY